MTLVVEKSFMTAGLALIAPGVVLFLLLGAYLAGIETSLARDAGVDGVGYYFGATAGSVMIGWGAILMATRRMEAAHPAVALGTGLGFLALSLMRFWAAMVGDAAHAGFAFLLRVETVVLLACALWFFQLSFGFLERLLDGFRSLRAAPLWVQVWVWAFLLPINLASFFVYGKTGHPFPGWAAIGFVFVLLVNVTLVIQERGISKLTSLPHLVPWVPLQIWSGVLIFTSDASLDPVVLAFAWVYFVVIGISNLFDVFDTWRWFRGERDAMRKDVRQGQSPARSRPLADE